MLNWVKLLITSIFLLILIFCRHLNRDAVLAHVKIHYQAPNYPIVTATATSSPKTGNAANTNSLQTPLQFQSVDITIWTKCFPRCAFNRTWLQVQHRTPLKNNTSLWCLWWSFFWFFWYFWFAAAAEIVKS